MMMKWFAIMFCYCTSKVVLFAKCSNAQSMKQIIQMPLASSELVARSTRIVSFESIVLVSCMHRFFSPEKDHSIKASLDFFWEESRSHTNSLELLFFGSYGFCRCDFMILEYEHENVHTHFCLQMKSQCHIKYFISNNHVWIYIVHATA